MSAVLAYALSHWRQTVAGLLFAGVLWYAHDLGYDRGWEAGDARSRAHEIAIVRLTEQVKVQSAEVEQWQTAAAQARQRSAKALESARAASATRQPQIEALATASQAGGALTCTDAVGHVRDGLR